MRVKRLGLVEIDTCDKVNEDNEIAGGANEDGRNVVGDEENGLLANEKMAQESVNEGETSGVGGVGKEVGGLNVGVAVIGTGGSHSSKKRRRDKTTTKKARAMKNMTKHYKSVRCPLCKKEAVHIGHLVGQNFGRGAKSHT